MTEIGLFPLPLVLLPTEQVPLHIFEERYKDLIAECLDDEAEFGLVYADEAGIREIGTRAAVIEVLTRFEDGRMNILVEGRGRFRLLELTSGRAFQTGETTSLEDVDDVVDADTEERARALFDRLRELTSSEIQMPEPGTPRLSYVLAARVELAVEAKLELLAETSENVRLERVCELLEEAAVAVERQRTAAERAAGNGKVELG